MHIYITDYIIILMFSDTEIEKNMMIAEVFQNSSFSSILYFFYTVELLDICNNSNKKFNISIFVNDITLLIYRFFTEINYHTLTQAHNWCLNWACRYSIFFAFEKYELIHLTCWFKKFNMQVQLQLKNIIKKLSILICIFNVWLDFKLCWDKYIKMIKCKMII